LGSNYHPNSVLLEFYEKSENNENDEKRVFSLIGSSIGGGNVEIIEIDGMEAGFDGDRPTLIEIHHDQHGVLAKIMEVISIMGYDVKEMHLSRNIRKQEALSWMELSKTIDPRLIKMLYKIKPIKKVRWLNV
jgi:L-serine dehydratase